MAVGHGTDIFSRDVRNTVFERSLNAPTLICSGTLGMQGVKWLTHLVSVLRTTVGLQVP